ncbi:MAG TPA: hypothetical protein DEA90_08615 [Opitutae bacterium]|nr:hypothetical protein [Puniceicoccaceae bacterium]HBR94212.1 hypothetical protein [Opitutae bacterium]|tara:strand:- start:13599 stop:15338 length:1740 start_codon:yes stop_codon:yes gene_type:complete
MYFNKIPPAVNFIRQASNDQAAQRSSELTQLGGDVFRYRIESSQWEQKSQAQLNLDCFKDEQVRAQLSEHPHCGLWLDIDYMDAYKVFTVVKDGFENHRRRIKALQDNGRKIVPIIDPGVKYSEGYPTFDSGRESDVFCKTSDGHIYSGFVWPGRTAFPDYSQESAREWWAKQLEQYTTEYAFDGYWLDMNDPSTGSAELEDMRFNHAQDSHSCFHNQYAYGMQQASRKGLSAAIQQKRPFILSRSGFISSSRYSAIWTGDNWSNYFHLKASINMSLNLSLSGIPFNGPDVPGFEGDAPPQLAVDWFKAGFLFPFFRNHSAANTRQQEPWAFEDPYRQVIIHYIRLRYKLLPYLYHLFMEHAEHGDPILRPLFYEFSHNETRFDQLEDQFMVGPAIMQAPFVHEGENSRSILLPAGRWWDARSGRWLAKQSELNISADLESTPLFIRDGSIVSMLPGERKSQQSDLSDIECHIFISEDYQAPVTWTYRFDDGKTVDAPQSELRLQFKQDGESLVLTCLEHSLKNKTLKIRFVAHGKFNELHLQKSTQCTKLSLQPYLIRLTGSTITAQATAPITFKDPS